MVVKNVNYRGRKASLGKVDFDDHGLAFFAGYHTCPCGQRGKILINMNDVRTLIQHFGGTREPMRIRMARKLIKHYDI